MKRSFLPCLAFLFAAGFSLAQDEVPARDPDHDDDGDGLSNAQELLIGTDPDAIDSDEDTLPDATEAASTNGLNPLDPDSDGDGLGDAEELGGLTDPSSPDSDTDGIPDAAEYHGKSDPNANDSDGDGIHDAMELGNDARPDLADTDADGMGDHLEMRLGSDPADPHFDGRTLSLLAAEWGLTASDLAQSGAPMEQIARWAKPRMTAPEAPGQAPRLHFRSLPYIHQTLLRSTDMKTWVPIREILPADGSQPQAVSHQDQLVGERAFYQLAPR